MVDISRMRAQKRPARLRAASAALRRVEEAPHAEAPELSVPAPPRRGSVPDAASPELGMPKGLGGAPALAEEGGREGTLAESGGTLASSGAR